MVFDATGNPQAILLLGGTSEIGLAICERYLRNAHARVVLACMPGDPLRDTAKAQLERVRRSRVANVAALELTHRQDGARLLVYVQRMRRLAVQFGPAKQRMHSRQRERGLGQPGVRLLSALGVCSPRECGGQPPPGIDGRRRHAGDVVARAVLEVLLG